MPAYVPLRPDQYPPCVIGGCTKRSFSARARRCAEHRTSCVVPGCNGTAAARTQQNGRVSYNTLCEAHYGRKRGRSKTPFDAPVRRNGDNWHKNSSGYLQRSVQVDKVTGRRKNELQHRVVMEQLIGRSLLEGETVHHRNGVRDDNRPENLELWSTAQPYGQRVSDKIRFALAVLDTYGSDPSKYT